MIKCILIFLWIYIGIYYVIEAADADEHVHIKLHMPRGHRKHNHHHHAHHKKRQLPLHYNAAPLPPREPPQLYHETPHNYLTEITKSPTQQQQHYLQYTKKLPASHLHETIGQLLETDDVVYSGSVEGDTVADTDDEGEEHMQYLVENFASFPQPSTSSTYETKLIPQHSHGFSHRETDEEDNEIGDPVSGNRDSELIGMEEGADNYPRHRPYAEGFTAAAKTMKNEQQLLQQIFQQQQEQHQQQHNQFEQADIMKTAKLRGNKHKKAEKEYHSEDDMTESMMYSAMPLLTTTFAQGNNAKADHRDSGFKALTVDDIWSQLQRQYLNKYVPQAQPLNEGGDDVDETSLKSTTKRKRTTIRQRPIKPARQPTQSFWPAKTLNFENIHQPTHPQDDNHSYPFSSSPTLSSFTTSSRATELFDDTRAFRRPYNKLNGHNAAAHHTDADVDFHVANDDDDVRIQFNTDNVYVGDDDDNSSHDASFEESVHQRGKKFVGNTGHVAYGKSNGNNPLNYHDLYGAFSTPITATVATKVHPSTYHPKLTRASSSSYYGDLVSPTLSHESTSYQWHTQQHNPDSYQTYHSHHQQEPLKQQLQEQQQQQQQHLQQHQLRFRKFQPQTSALLFPKATITQMPSTASTAISSPFASSLSPTMSNDFTSSPATKSTLQPSRYKKRKNRIKTKKNRIVVV